jgi:hypothetical protein
LAPPLHNQMVVGLPNRTFFARNVRLVYVSASASPSVA